MSIRRQDGRSADLVDRRLDDLSAVERAYLDERPAHRKARLKHLAVLYFVRGHSWPYSTIAVVLGYSGKGVACAAKTRCERRLIQLAKEIFSRVARDD